MLVFLAYLWGLPGVAFRRMIIQQQAATTTTVATAGLWLHEIGLPPARKWSAMARPADTLTQRPSYGYLAR